MLLWQEAWSIRSACNHGSVSWQFVSWHSMLPIKKQYRINNPGLSVNLAVQAWKHVYARIKQILPSLNRFMGVFVDIFYRWARKYISLFDCFKRYDLWLRKLNSCCHGNYTLSCLKYEMRKVQNVFSRGKTRFCWIFLFFQYCKVSGNTMCWPTVSHYGQFLIYIGMLTRLL